MSLRRGKSAVSVCVRQCVFDSVKRYFISNQMIRKASEALLTTGLTYPVNRLRHAAARQLSGVKLFQWVGFV